MKKRKVLDFDKDLTFGLEIEFTNAKLDEIVKYLDEVSPKKRKFKGYYYNWNYSIDETFCKRNEKEEVFGGEVQSAILRNNKKSFKNLKYVLEKLKENNALVDDRTGLHYHISIDAFKNNYKYVLKFLRLYLTHEDVIYKCGYNGSTPRGALFKYSFPIRKKLIYYISQLEKAIDYNEIIDVLKSINIQKSQGVNFSYILTELNTIEFRMCNGSLDYNVIVNEIDLFCNLVLSCQKELDEELIEYKLNKLKENPGTLEDYSKINMKML